MLSIQLCEAAHRDHRGASPVRRRAPNSYVNVDDLNPSDIFVGLSVNRSPRNQSIRTVFEQIARHVGVGFESRPRERMLATLSRTACCRLIALFIVMLVVSPYSEPFATMNGADFGGSGAVDVGDSSKTKTKTPTHDALPTLPSVVIGSDHSLIGVRSIVRPAARDLRPGQHTILRL